MVCLPRSSLLEFNPRGSRKEKRGAKTKVEAITAACSLARTALTGEGTKDQVNSVPDVVRNDVTAYLQECKEALREKGSIPGAYKIFAAWKNPVSSAFSLTEEIKKLAPTWIQMGLLYIQALDKARGSSLAALCKYPSYQFSPAGELPRAFAENLVDLVTGRKQ